MATLNKITILYNAQAETEGASDLVDNAKMCIQDEKDINRKVVDFWYLHSELSKKKNRSTTRSAVLLQPFKRVLSVA